jgi:hypothetical protein
VKGLREEDTEAGVHGNTSINITVRSRRSSQTYFPTAQASSPTYHVLLISYLGNVYLESINGMQFSPLVSVLALSIWSNDRILVESEKNIA